MTRPVRARIDLPALQHNFERVRQYAPASRIMAVVKAHAYGHGLINAARALPGAHAFGVVSMDEAISLREAGFDRRIVLLEGLYGADETGLAEGYRVDVVGNGQQAVEACRQRRYDLILMDIQMPVMDGLTMLRHARELDSSIPIIVMSAEVNRDRLIQAIEQGANDYLLKPIDIDLLSKKCSLLFSARVSQGDVKATS